MDTKRTFAFVVPTLNELAAQNEDVVQLLLFAANRLEQAAHQRGEKGFTATILTVEPDLGGWKQLSALFSPELLACIAVETLKEPATPNLALASHKPAYQLFEYLKSCSFDEVHCLDHQGLIYYATQAKQLGLYFLNTLFATHIVGSTIFRYAAADGLLDDLGALMDDMLERGTVERADILYVHDYKAWTWYENKIKARDASSVYDLAWAQTKSTMSPAQQEKNTLPQTICYYGSLSASDGLPIFCDALDRLLPALAQPVTISFVGTAQAMGGMDAVSYIRVRSTKWKTPVTIKRDLSIAEEIALLFELNGIVVCNTVRRDGLRARLVSGAGLPLLQIKPTLDPSAVDSEVCSPNPNQIAKQLGKMLAIETRKCLPCPNLATLWGATRPSLAGLDAGYSSPPLAMMHTGGPKVSVCVTHFGRPQKLRLALASLKAQRYQNFEVIVVDDGSPDLKVQQELDSIKAEIEPLGWRLLVQENRYLGAARNYGASQATGDYLLFMDDDNVAKPDEISMLVAVALRTGSDLVTSFFDTFENEESLTGKAPPSLRLTPFGSDPTLGILTNCYGDANALYSRAIFDKLGGFTEDYGITHEDWEFFCRASLEGAKLVCVPESLFWYRVDPGGMFRGQATQLHKNANLRRHIRPYLANLPYYQAQLVQLAQGLTAELPIVPVGPATRNKGSAHLRTRREQLPYARVAVIMRTKDRPLLLRRAVRSVLDQTFKDWLLVIVNDGGAPENVEVVTAEVASELGERLVVLHHPHSLGMQTAANAGISHCDSDFIIIHDDDDSWRPTFLARTVSHLDQQGWQGKVGGVITWAQVIVEEIAADGEIKQHNQFVFNDRLHSLSLLELAQENRFPPISFLFHRAAFETVGPFQEQYSVLGDWEFHLRFLQRYDIHVIQEPLANYHHRTQATTGIYGNSIHAQNHVHQAKRVELHNDILRAGLTETNSLALAQLMALGDLQKTIMDQQSKEFQRLHDYVWTVEQRVIYIADHIYNTGDHQASLTHPGFHPAFPSLNHNSLAHTTAAGRLHSIANEPPDKEAQPLRDYLQTIEKRLDEFAYQLYRANHTKPGRNLIHNGDFRRWTGVGPLKHGPQNRYAYREVCPGVILCYDGHQNEYRVEQRVYDGNPPTLPWGKSYLHVEHKGATKDGTWFMVECTIPAVEQLSGQTIAISGYSRLIGAQNWIGISGRYNLGDGKEMAWPDQYVTLSPELSHWHCLVTCPIIHKSALKRGHHTRILLKLPVNQPFEFDLTNVQVELGMLPTEFEYNSTITIAERLSALWTTIKTWLKSVPGNNRAEQKQWHPENAL